MPSFKEAFMIALRKIFSCFVFKEKHVSNKGTYFLPLEINKYFPQKEQYDKGSWDIHELFIFGQT